MLFLIWVLSGYLLMGLTWAIFLAIYANGHGAAMVPYRLVKQWLAWPYYFWRVFMR